MREISKEEGLKSVVGDNRVSVSFSLLYNLWARLEKGLVSLDKSGVMEGSIIYIDINFDSITVVKS